MDLPKRRKLLVASVGIASVSYALVACGKDQHPTTGNLPAPPPPTETVPVTGNLPAPPPIEASAPPPVGNTVAPMDAAADVGTPSTDAGKAADAGKPAPKK